MFIKAKYPKKFVCLLDFQCAKYGMSCAKKSFENLHGICNHKSINFHY